jgi:hypothetical protein
MPANILADNLYESLALPWTIDPPSTSFDKASYRRIIFSQENGNALMGSYPLTLKQLEQSIYSASPYIRWSEANAELKSSDQDIAKFYIQKMKDVLGGSETMEMEVKMVLVMFKKVA